MNGNGQCNMCEYLILSRQRPHAGVGNQHDGGGIVRRLDAPKRDSCCHRVDVLNDCQPWSAYADHKSQRFVALSTYDIHINNTCFSHGSYCERVSLVCVSSCPAQRFLYLNFSIE